MLRTSLDSWIFSSNRIPTRFDGDKCFFAYGLLGLEPAAHAVT